MAGSAGNLVQAVDYYPFGQERLCGGLFIGSALTSLWDSIENIFNITNNN
jgi:hypothetical protein